MSDAADKNKSKKRKGGSKNDADGGGGGGGGGGAYTKPISAIRNSLPPEWYSLLMAVAGAGTVGLSVYVAAKAAGVLGRALLYHALVYGAFLGIYMVMPGGFGKHFNVPATDAKKDMSIADVLYYTAVVHSTAGFGDIYPTSFYGRTCVALHLILVFLASAGLVPFIKS
jgi:hypothetical protein